jgi:predicted GNAT family N-acyltransferase
MSAMTAEIRVREVVWEQAAPALRAIRHQVFVCEQSVPVELEWDGLDPACRHVLAETARGEVVGTGRLLPDGRIGRMAVLAPWRRTGVGSALLHELLVMARARGDTAATLHAQTYVAAFYRRAGFEVIGPAFMEAGIEHVPMRLVLDAAASAQSRGRSG